MIGSLPTDYKEQELKARAAAEAAALANINTDGGKYAEEDARFKQKIEELSANLNRPIGSKAVLNGKPVLWAGRDLEWQSPETFKKLETEGYGGDPDYMLKLGVQANRINIGLNKAVEAAAPVLEPVMSAAQSTYNLIPERSATKELIEGGAKNIAWGLNKVQEGMTATSRAAGVHPFFGNTAIEQGIDAALPWLPLGLLTGAVKHSKKVKGLTSGQQKLLRYLTPEAIEAVTDPGMKMLYGKAAKMLSTPGLSKRNAEALLQTGPNSGLIELLKDVTDPMDMDKVATSYFVRNPIYFSGGYGFNLDHLVPISSTAKLASKVKPAVFQEALALQLKKFGRKFGHDQEFSLMPRVTHAAKHTGIPEIGDISPDWKTKYLDGIIDSLPENASVEQVSEALSQMYDTSLYHTGQALQSKEYHSIRREVLDSLPPKVQRVLGKNFDITGRISSVEEPRKWKYFLGYLRQAPGEMKTVIREMSLAHKKTLEDLIIA